MPVIINVSAGKRDLAPKISPVQLRTELWKRFGKRKVYVRRKQYTNRFLVYCPHPHLIPEVARICAKYEDLCDHPDAVSIHIISAPPHNLLPNPGTM